MKIAEFNYFDNGADCFAHFAKFPYAVFLDGSHPSYPHERYNIIAAEPRRVIPAQANDQNSEDIFLQVQHELDRLNDSLQIPPAIAHLPFKIGALGYVGYDYARRYYALPNPTIRDIDLPDAIMGIYDWSIVIDHQEKKTWLIALSHASLEWIKQQLSLPPTPTDRFKITTPFESNMSFDQYGQHFSKIKHHIRQGDCYQVNLCQRFSATYTGSPWEAYQRLREKNPAPFSAYLKLGHHALLSLSPERFLKVQNGWVETKPIKGTIARSENPEYDQIAMQKLLSSEKERAENIMIVDLLRNDLGKCCRPGSIRVPQLAALESFAHVHHLVSTVVGQKKEGLHAVDVLRHCFPGGSITGAPKYRAMQIIDTLEPHCRSAYCGTIGYIDVSGNMDCQIIIRTVISDAHRLYCYAGGAIVADSQHQAEYQECHVKVKKLLQILEGV